MHWKVADCEHDDHRRQHLGCFPPRPELRWKTEERKIDITKNIIMKIKLYRENNKNRVKRDPSHQKAESLG